MSICSAEGCANPARRRYCSDLCADRDLKRRRRRGDGATVIVAFAAIDERSVVESFWISCLDDVDPEILWSFQDDARRIASWAKRHDRRSRTLH